MPIDLPFTLRNLDAAEFDEVDRLVMPLAYAAQNALGRLCDERVYENKLAASLRAAGIEDVQTQVAITVRHGAFAKEYRLDLLVRHAIYELKTVQEFAAEHDAQAFHYAMLADVNHIKLLNFRPAKVRGQLRFNAVRAKDRHSPQWHADAWWAVTPRCKELRQRLESVVADWGTHLDFRLYEEALVFFCGGEANCLRRVPVIHDGQTLGSHALKIHAEQLAFVVTGFPDPTTQRGHIQRVRELTGIRAIQWMNLNKRDIHLVTV